jgi:hypothetical protein
MIILDASAVVDLLTKPAVDTEALRDRIRCWSRSSVNAVLAKRGPLRTRNGLQKTRRSGSRSVTRLEVR